MIRMKRTLGFGEPIPDGHLLRFLATDGYWMLRWKVGKGRYVEVREHRAVAGFPPSDLHVHHIDGDKQNNDPDNLELVDPAEHCRAHTLRLDVVAAKELYLSGLSTTEVGRRLHVDGSNVSRQLRLAGVQMRPPGRTKP